MISIFALGSDLPEIEVIRSALSEERKFAILITAQGALLVLLCFVKKEIFSMSKHESYNGVFISNNGQFSGFLKVSAPQCPGRQPNCANRQRRHFGPGGLAFARKKTT